MKFEKNSASLALKSGLAAAALQVLLFFALLDTMIRPELDVAGVLSILFLLCLAVTAFIGFWLLRRSPELGYFAQTAIAGLFLLIAGFIASGTVGAFVLPGAVAILLSALMFLIAGEGPLPLWRRVLVVLTGLIWLVFVVALLYSAGYILNIPGFKGPGVQTSQSH